MAAIASPKQHVDMTSSPEEILNQFTPSYFLEIWQSPTHLAAMPMQDRFFAIPDQISMIEESLVSLKTAPSKELSLMNKVLVAIECNKSLALIDLLGASSHSLDEEGVTDCEQRLDQVVRTAHEMLGIKPE